MLKPRPFGDSDDWASGQEMQKRRRKATVDAYAGSWMMSVLADCEERDCIAFVVGAASPRDPILSLGW